MIHSIPRLMNINYQRTTFDIIIHLTQSMRREAIFFRLHCLNTQSRLMPQTAFMGTSSVFNNGSFPDSSGSLEAMHG